MSITERRRRERADRHALIIASARNLAEAEGWEAVTTRRLAELVEYSQPVLYSHFDGKDAIVRANPTDIELLHQEAAPLVARDALVRVPVWTGRPVLMSLGARDPQTLPARQAAATLAFLGRAVAAALAR